MTTSPLTRRLALAAVLAFPLAVAAQAPQAGWKPSRPVTIVVPYAPGGGTDATARAVARRLSEVWGQPVLVENLGGADGLIGTRRVIDARPDGQTLLLQVPSILLMKYQSSLKGVNPVAQLEPVSALAMSPTAVVVTGKLPIKNLAELAAYCRKPGVACSAGSGENSSKLRARLFADHYGLHDLAIVNYRGTSPIISDLVSGNLTMAFTGLTAALPLHKTGQLRIVSTNGDQRASAVPDVPTSTEAGWPNSYSVTWYGMFAPKGTPARITGAVAAALRESGRFTDVQQAIELAGADPRFSTPAEFVTQIARDDALLSARAAKYPIE
ncbi:MAG: tripartite tricarboxylate transporter substrate binding protein [Pseudomonadota bacterium]